MKRAAKKTRKRWWNMSLIILFIVGLGIGGYGLSIYNNVKGTVNDKMHEPIKSIDTNLAKKRVKAIEPITILLMGIDAKTGKEGRSDALIILSLYPKQERMQVISIPRDTKTMIAGKGVEDKINHAYAFGGTAMTVATVEDFLGIELDYYIRMNMSGVEELVNEIGNITVTNNFAWDYAGHHFKEGDITLNGEETLAFSRMRKQDPHGDFGRTQRQRQVIQGIIDKSASVGSVTKIGSMVDILGSNMGTNMDFNDMKNIFKDYRDTRKNMDDYMMQGHGEKIDGIYYMIVSDEEIKKVNQMINRTEM